LFSLNLFFELGLIAAGLILFWRFLNRPATILYALALAVSFISVNIHIGFTFYVSRILLAWLLIVILIRRMHNLRRGIDLHVNPAFLILFSGTIFIQTITSLSAPSVSDSFRQMFIYLSMMSIFLAVLILGVEVAVIVRAIYFYLAFAIVQGLVGVYQVIGGILGWPMYQDFLRGISMGNLRHAQRVFWFPEEMVPRAFGFFSDANQYAGYMVGVIVLALALVVWNRKRMFPYLVLVIGFAGLMLSLSRSGMITLVVFGIPALLLFRHRVRFSVRWLFRPMLLLGGVLILLVVAGMEMGGDLQTRSGEFNIWNTIRGRFESLAHPGESERYHQLSRLMALDAFVSSPLIGVGLGVNSAPWHSARYNEDWAGAHSHHLDTLGQTGLLGAGLEWIFMLVVGIHMWRGLLSSRKGSRERAVLAGVLAAFIAIILGNLFYHYYLNDFVWFLMGCGVALSHRIRLEAQVCGVTAKSSDLICSSATKAPWPSSGSQSIH